MCLYATGVITSDIINEANVRKAVKDRYSKVAEKSENNMKSSCCSGGKYVETIGYDGDLVAGLPADAIEMSAGCGNPTAIASLKKGQTVLDLGSGGGIDVFIAAKEVGPEGKVIGVDSTPEMIWKARENARKINAANVEFRLSEIECMPVESSSIDVIISNCVINLSPDKGRAFQEAFRVLKPGGTMAVSDMVTTGELNAPDREKLASWASCIGGAIPEAEYAQKMRDAGFIDVTVESRHVYTMEELAFLTSEEGCGCGCGSPAGITSLGGPGISRIATIRISARKP